MIGVLVSGEGTNLQALIDAGLPIAAVASNRGDAGALAHADEAVRPDARREWNDCRAIIEVLGEGALEGALTTNHHRGDVVVRVPHDVDEPQLEPRHAPLEPRQQRWI